MHKHKSPFTILGILILMLIAIPDIFSKNEHLLKSDILMDGCTDSSACNFDPSATVDDGSCIFEFACDNNPCTNGGIFVWNATTCDCFLDVATVLGCTDPTACNFNSAANCDDGSCIFGTGPSTCNTDCLLGDLEIWDPSTCECIVDVVVVLGCSNPNSDNYDPNANCDDGSCDCPNPGNCDDLDCLTEDSFNTTTCMCEYAPILIPDCDDNCQYTIDVYDAANCECENILTVPSCDDNCPATADSYNESTCECENICDNDPCTNGGTYVLDANSCNCILDEPTVLGCMCVDDPNYDPNVNCDDGSCECIPNGCTDMSACNFDPTATIDDGSCIFETICDPNSCTNGGVYVWDATVCDCVLDLPTIYGCTNPSATVYDPTANCDDGSCDCIPDGCINPVACNFDPTATCSDGSCIFETTCDTDPCTNGGVYTWDDTTCECILDLASIFGCTNPNSANYDQLANCDDGSCGCNTQNTDTTFVELLVCDPNSAGITIENYINTLGCDSIIIINAFFDATTCEFGRINFPIYYDANENGIQDSTENFLSFASVLVEPTNEVYFSNNTNGGTQFLPFGTYTISYNQANTPLWGLTTAEASFEVILDINNPVANISFGLKPTQAVSGVQIFMSYSIPRCNEFVLFDIIAMNIGTTVADGSIHFSNDIDAFTFVEIIDTPDIVDPPNFTWNFSNLTPGNSAKRQIKILIPGPPNIQIGAITNFLTEVEYTDANGTATISQNYPIEIQCAYDPNDKLVQPTYPENYALIDEDLIYTVRFQNTGNAEAYDVVIEDEIDPNLDLTTFRVLASSHDEVLSTKINNNLVTFEFENIFLPDSTTNFDASQGYVTYSIRPFDNIEENTFIQNTANIFFDFNPAIVTNTTENNMVSTFDADEDDSMIWDDCDDNNPDVNPDATEIAGNGIDEDCDGADLPVAVISFEDNEINIFPNPFMDKLTITQLNVESLNFEIINNTGLILQQGQLNTTSNNIALNDIPAGIYFLKIMNTSTHNYHVEKVVKLK